jgi:2,3-bisphosphoglycerate-dependent phosphoglycerate mutase
MTHLYLIRHARSTWNTEGRMQGQADPPLDELGEKQIQALAERLAQVSISAVYSSPLQRALRTAEAVAAHHRLTVNLDPRLMERHLGEWAGLTGNEADDKYPQVRSGKDWRLLGPPGGESMMDLMTRAASALGAIVDAHPNDRVVVVSHGGTLNAYLMHLMGLPAASHVHFAFGNTAIARVQLENDQVHLLGLGDERHLDAMRT